MMREFRQTLGLVPCGAFYLDPAFLVALLAGATFWIALWLATPISPLPWSRMLSWQYTSLVLWQPCAEEVGFRGILQRTARQVAWGRRSCGQISGANAAVSVLFVLVHLWHHPPLWALAVLLPSLVFGWLRDHYGSVYPCMVLHAFYNAGYFWLAGLPG
jgi:membrane protease YdiL (CAAX protease family)